MPNALIIEDENIAVQHLTRLLAATAPDITILTVLQTVEETVEWFNAAGCDNTSKYKPTNEPTHSRTDETKIPDIVFLDIHLADGLAFHIFDQTTIPCPIVFTTAYDEYALQAFRVNSIDYLLKPINPDDLKRAIEKLHRLTLHPSLPNPDGALNHAIEMLQQHYRQYKHHFLIPLRDKLVPLDVNEIACIYLTDGNTVALTLDGHTHPLDRPLDGLMAQLDPTQFFRVNRQFIVAHSAIREISVWLLGRYTLTLSVDTPERIVVPKARVSEFKDWYTN